MTKRLHFASPDAKIVGSQAVIGKAPTPRGAFYCWLLPAANRSLAEAGASPATDGTKAADDLAKLVIADFSDRRWRRDGSFGLLMFLLDSGHLRAPARSIAPPGALRHCSRTGGRA